MAPIARMCFAIQALTLNYGGPAKGAKPHEIMWSKPAPGSYKLNVDACFFSNSTCASGVVLRNEKGEAVAGADDLLDNLLDAPTTEARALLKGLQLIEDLGCRPVVVESDSLQIVEAFNGVIDIWSSYAAILIDCFHTARRIGQVKVQHCPREANVVAHKIARHAFDLNSALFWDRIPPSFIMSDVLNDVSLFD